MSRPHSALTETRLIRRWLRIALRLLLATLALLAVALGIAVAVLDQDDYRDALVRFVAQHSPYTLAIDGPLELAFAPAPTLHAARVTLRSKSGEARLAVAAARKPGGQRQQPSLPAPDSRQTVRSPFPALRRAAPRCREGPGAIMRLCHRAGRGRVLGP